MRWSGSARAARLRRRCRRSRTCAATRCGAGGSNSVLMPHSAAMCPCNNALSCQLRNALCIDAVMTKHCSTELTKDSCNLASLGIKHDERHPPLARSFTPAPHALLPIRACLPQAAPPGSLGSSRCGSPCAAWLWLPFVLRQHAVQFVLRGMARPAYGSHGAGLPEWEEREEILEQRDAGRLRTLAAALVRQHRKVRAVR